MRIGILTLPLHVNYGGILQAYALQTVLERMGHEVILLDSGRWSSKKRIKNLIYKLKYFVLSLFKGTRVLSTDEIFEITGCNIHSFIEEYFPNRSKVHNTSSIKSLELDEIIVGSDQVWRYGYSKNIEYFYLDFAIDWNIKRIAYACSFGIENWAYPADETSKCSKLLKLFNAVSVREESGQHMCKEFLGKDAKLVLDPTMLLSYKDYERLLKGKEDRHNNYIFSYILDQDLTKNECIKSVEKIINMPVKAYRLVSLSVRDKDKQTVLPGIIDWLSSIRFSSFVVTDSFHGCVFSIIFNKPFVALNNSDRGSSRFDTLLSYFDLKNRQVSSIEDVSDIIENEINWEDVNLKLDKLKSASLDFLITNI